MMNSHTQPASHTHTVSAITTPPATTAAPPLNFAYYSLRLSILLLIIIIRRWLTYQCMCTTFGATLICCELL